MATTTTTTLRCVLVAINSTMLISSPEEKYEAKLIKIFQNIQYSKYSSPEEKYEAKLIKELGDELQPMSTPGMAVFTLRCKKNFFGQFGNKN